MSYTVTGSDATFNESTVNPSDSKVAHHMESSIMHSTYMIEHKDMVPATYLQAIRTAQLQEWQ